MCTLSHAHRHTHTLTHTHTHDDRLLAYQEKHSCRYFLFDLRLRQLPSVHLLFLLRAFIWQMRQNVTILELNLIWWHFFVILPLPQLSMLLQAKMDFMPPLLQTYIQQANRPYMLNTNIHERFFLHFFCLFSTPLFPLFAQKTVAQSPNRQSPMCVHAARLYRSKGETDRRGCLVSSKADDLTKAYLWYLTRRRRTTVENWGYRQGESKKDKKERVWVVVT